MTHSRLLNKIRKEKTEENKNAYNKQKKSAYVYLDKLQKII